jgi:3-polyprenyl-4-hydroxybenzoate decarboxylase
MNRQRMVVGISGASGFIYGVRLLHCSPNWASKAT